MTIGMVTFHRAHNIGANLQAYALNKYINTHIGQCEIIDLFPNNQTAHKNKIRKIISKAKSLLCFRANTLNRKFARFQKENYILSSKTYYGDDDIRSFPPQYDIILSGSDQILNTTLSGSTKSYYLDFDDHSTKISYGSSFGRTDLSEDEYRLISSELRKFSALSVREESAGKIIENTIGILPQLVLDSVFLLSSDEWIQLKKHIDLPPKYIFVYAMEVTDYLLHVVDDAKNLYNLPVIVLYGCEGNHTINGEVISNCGPQEFLSCVEQASLVITNSFHGIAFSIIFGKRFICVAHSSRNARLENIMTLIGCEKKLILQQNDGIVVTHYVIEGDVALNRLAFHTMNSKKYLLEACSI